MMQRFPNVFLAIAMVLTTAGGSVSCANKSKAGPEKTPSKAPGQDEASTNEARAEPGTVDWRYGRILLQPHFWWMNGRDTYNGTAFLTRANDGAIYGVGSAHYILGDVLAKRVELVVIPTSERIVETDQSFGPVGDGDPSTPAANEFSLAEDFFFVPVSGEVEDDQVVELDQRTDVEVGERVWFPNKSTRADRGYELIEGRVTQVEPGWIRVEVEEQFRAQSQSGTPFVSQKTGKAIGTLVRYDGSGDLPIVHLAPAHALHQALHSGREVMPLPEALVAENGTMPLPKRSDRSDRRPAGTESSGAGDCEQSCRSQRSDCFDTCRGDDSGAGINPDPACERMCGERKAECLTSCAEQGVPTSYGTAPVLLD